MGVESKISVALDIRFIDARVIATEAKLNLGIEGYHDESREEEIVNEAMRVYRESLSADARTKMAVQQYNLERVKQQHTRRNPNNNRAGRSSSLSSSVCSSSNDYSEVSDMGSRKGSQTSMESSSASTNAAYGKKKKKRSSLMPFRKSWAVTRGQP